MRSWVTIFTLPILRHKISSQQSLFVFRYDTGGDKFIDQKELQVMMEKLEAPQTYLGLKSMIKEVDEDQDGKISFREVCIGPDPYSMFQK